MSQNVTLVLGLHNSLAVAAGRQRSLPLLTFVRKGELRGAEWPEFDTDSAEWRISAKRMKMREPHVVPLSTQALAVLEELRALQLFGRASQDDA